MASVTSAPRRRKQRTFVITFAIDGQPYTVAPLDCDPGIGSAAFRFHKQGGDDAVYDLYLSTYGWQCQCKGFLRHGHCKHVGTVQKAGQLFGSAPPPNDAERCERVTDAQLAEAMEHAPPMPEPTEQEVNAMADYFGQE
jgi:hypothetical protein